MAEDDTIFVILILAATLLFAAVLADWLAVKLLCPSNMLHSNKSSEPDVQRMAPLELPKSVLYHTQNKCAATPRAAAAPVLQIDHAPSVQSTSSPWDSFLCCLPLAPPLNEMNRAAMPHQPTSNRTRIIQRSIQQPPSSPASVMVDLAHSSPVLLRKAAQQPSSPSSPASAMPNMAPSSSRPTAILSVTTPIGSVFVERLSSDGLSLPSACSTSQHSAASMSIMTTSPGVSRSKTPLSALANQCWSCTIFHRRGYHR